MLHLVNYLCPIDLISLHNIKIKIYQDGEEEELLSTNIHF